MISVYSCVYSMIYLNILKTSCKLIPIKSLKLTLTNNWYCTTTEKQEKTQTANLHERHNVTNSN